MHTYYVRTCIDTRERDRDASATCPVQTTGGSETAARFNDQCHINIQDWSPVSCFYFSENFFVLY